MIDLRSAAAYRGWHHPRALHLDFSHALAAYRSFARDRAYVLVCEVGLKSAHLAEKMREAGFDGLPAPGGIKGLMALAGRRRKRRPRRCWRRRCGTSARRRSPPRPLRNPPEGSYPQPYLHFWRSGG